MPEIPAQSLAANDKPHESNEESKPETTSNAENEPQTNVADNANSPVAAPPSPATQAQRQRINLRHSTHLTRLRKQLNAEWQGLD